MVEDNNQENVASVDQPETEMSEWERRLEEAGKLGDSSNADSKPTAKEEEAPKKKGLFGRKKK